MRLTNDQEIGGIPAKDMRDILRKLPIGASFDQKWLAEELYWHRTKNLYKHVGRRTCLDWVNWSNTHEYIYYPDCLRQWNASRRASSPLIRTLVRDGLIELDKAAPEPRAAQRYKLTGKGLELCRATAARPVHRKNADATLNEFMERVGIVNEDARFLYRVTAVVLYGSYLRGSERPADVDLAIEVERKITDHDKFREACWNHLSDSGRAYKRVGYEFTLPIEEVFVFLKQRKRTLSVHPMHDFIEMDKHQNFSYEVLFGDKHKIAERLAQQVSLVHGE